MKNNQPSFKEVSKKVKWQISFVLLHSGRVCVAQAVCRQHGPRLCGAPQSRPGELSATCGISSSPVKWQDPLPLPHWGTWWSSESIQQFICLPLSVWLLFTHYCVFVRNMAGRKRCVRQGFRQRYRTFCFLFLRQLKQMLSQSLTTSCYSDCRQIPGSELSVPPSEWEIQISTFPTRTVTGAQLMRLELKLEFHLSWLLCVCVFSFSDASWRWSTTATSCSLTRLSCFEQEQ